MRRSLVQTVAVFRTVFGNRELRRVELAFAGFNAAEWAVWIALLVFAYEQGGTTTAGLVAVAQLVPAALFAPLGSVLGDRYRPGRVLLWSYVAQAVGMGATAAVLLGGGPALLAYGTAALAATAVTVTRPTMSALTPALARRPEELTAVNVVSGWVESVSVFVAPAVAGVLIAVASVGAVFLTMALVVTLGAVLVSAVPGPPPAGEGDVQDAVHTALADAFRVVRSERSARVLVAIICADFVALGALDVLYPPLAIDVLGQSPAWAGYLNAAFGAGATLAVLVTSGLVGRPRLMPSVLLGLALYAGAFALLAVHQVLGTALVLLALAGLGRAIVDVSARTLLQRVAPTDMLARIFGLVEALSMAALAVGSLLVAVLVGVGGVSLAFVGVGLLLPLAVLVFGRSLFGVDRDATVPVVQIGLLRSLPLFAALPPVQLETVARSLQPVEAPAGTVLIREGDEGDRLYVVAEGTVAVSRGGAFVAELGRGDGFGEIALLESRPRTATCTVATDAALYALERDDFLTAITGHPAAALEARLLAVSRLPESQASVADAGSSATRL